MSGVTHASRPSSSSEQDGPAKGAASPNLRWNAKGELAVEADALQGRLDGMGQNKARASCIAANGYQCFYPGHAREACCQSL